MEGHGELIGIVAALVILVLAFGSVVGAGLPIGVAVAGLVAGSGGLALLAGVMDVSTAAPTVATMVGLGVGIDYALLLVTRHVEYLRAGPRRGRGRRAGDRHRRPLGGVRRRHRAGLPDGSAAGRAPTYSSFGFATAIAVRLRARRRARCSCPPSAGSPARGCCRRQGAPRPRPRPATPLTARWAARVGRRPLPWAIAAARSWCCSALPALDMRTWPQDPSTQSRS